MKNYLNLNIDRNIGYAPSGWALILINYFNHETTNNSGDGRKNIYVYYNNKWDSINNHFTNMGGRLN